MNFKKPNLVEYKNGVFEVIKVVNGYKLVIESKRQMTYIHENYSQFYELYSHTHFAHGHVIASGLGFLLREIMLLENPNVSRIQVLEKSAELIEYHNTYNRDIMEKLEIVNCDANEFVGSCDTFLMDHLEFSNFVETFIKCLQNIKCTTSWFWPIELCCPNYEKYSQLCLSVATLPKLQRLEYEMLLEIFKRRKGGAWEKEYE